MGWSSGTLVFENVRDVIEEYVSDQQTKKNIYKDLIEAFENADCDNLHELYDEGYSAFDAAFGEMHPDWVAELNQNIYEDDDFLDD